MNNELLKIAVELLEGLKPRVAEDLGATEEAALVSAIKLIKLVNQAAVAETKRAA